MFWTKNETLGLKTKMSNFQWTVLPMTSKKEFDTMQMLLSDAEKFDNKGEKEVSDTTLKTLIDYIDIYLTKTHPKK